MTKPRSGIRAGGGSTGEETSVGKSAKGQAPRVAVLMGSDSDYEVMSEAVAVLREFGVAHEVRVRSAHRSPAATAEYAREAEARGIRVLIAGAGAAAHLAGVLAAESTLPVIGVPLAATSLGGLDALLATVQMPAGIPVAAVAIGKAGARNAGLLAVQILALSDPDLAGRLKEQRRRMAEQVEEKSRRVEERASAAE
jgi:5-(carboxyamino)imidazole ribonucleotide mutase